MRSEVAAMWVSFSGKPSHGREAYQHISSTVRSCNFLDGVEGDVLQSLRGRLLGAFET